ncbi:SwmB domain-containing protein [Paenibacillus sp. DYY-L-2]|uniref:SwmB domain-containing protein n=1 Tax=Paenibacillus sp. DYY-L-2 TaxID=3447013 RepID=UPI003F4F9D05
MKGELEVKRKVSLVFALLLVMNTLLGFGGQQTAKAISLSPVVSPSNGSVNVPLNTKLQVSFSGSKLRTNGKQTYVIARNVSSSYTEKMDVTVTQSTYVSTLVLTPPASLQSGSRYEISFPAGAFIVGETSGVKSPELKWTFTTTSSSNALTATSFYPTNGSTNVGVNDNLRITFNRNVKYNYAVSNAGIVLRKASNSSSVPITVAFSSNQVTIDPVNSLEAGTKYYVEIASNGIYDEQYGTYYAGLSGSGGWSFTTASSDKTAPVLQSATMYNNTAIILTYNETLDYSAYVPTSSYTVTVNGESRRVSYVSVSGSSVYVNLELGVAVGQNVSISYSGQTVKDLAGNSAPTFSGKAVTNGVDSVSPKPRDGYASGNKVTLYFTDSLKSPSSYAYQQFTVTANGTSKGISSMTQSGSTVTLYLTSSISNGEVVKVSYVPGSYPLQDYRGWDIAAFTDYYVRNYNDNVPPVLVGAQGSDRTIVLTYNEPLRTSVTPLKSQFSVLVNNSPVYVNAVEIVSDKVILTLASSFTESQNVTVSYVAGSNGIADLNGNLAGYINLQPVTYGAVANGVQSATVNGDTLTITYNTTLKSMSFLPVNQFSVVVDKVSAGIQSATISGNTVTLKLTSPVKAGQIVKLSYLVGASPLYDTQGNQLKSFNDVAVQNLTGGQGTQTPNGVQPSYLTVMSAIDFGVVGYMLDTSAAQASSSQSKSGQPIKKYTIDTDKLQASYKYLSDTNAGTKRVVFEVPATEKAAEVAFPLAPLMEFYSSGKTGSFAVKHNKVMYDLPIEKIPFVDISRALNAGSLTNSYVTVQLDPLLTGQAPTRNNSNVVTTTTLMNPVQIYVYAYNGATPQSSVDVAHKGQIYMKLANSTMSNLTYLARYNLSAGTVAFQPSDIQGTGSNLVFVGQVNGNSVLGPAIGTSYLTDTSSHWANKEITELTSKLIVEPRSGAKFEPNKNITRAEFAVFVAKGLGLEGDAANASRFSDVQGGSANAAYIGAAAKAGIINGNTDGTFKPGNSITREQMALMMVRAMEYAGHNISLGSTSAQVLGKFKDSAKIQSKDTVAKAVKEGIIQGVSTTQFQPAGNATRAQAAVMLKRVLDKLNYL